MILIYTDFTKPTFMLKSTVFAGSQLKIQFENLSSLLKYIKAQKITNFYIDHIRFKLYKNITARDKNVAI